MCSDIACCQLHQHCELLLRASSPLKSMEPQNDAHTPVISYTQLQKRQKAHRVALLLLIWQSAQDDEAFNS